MSEPSSILSGLNPRQREAVHYIDGPLLVLAGAGNMRLHVRGPMRIGEPSYAEPVGGARRLAGVRYRCGPVRPRCSYFFR